MIVCSILENSKHVEASVKSLFFCMVVISLCSCGRSNQSSNQDQAEKDLIASQKVQQFDLPQLNFQKTITLDKEISTLYDQMGINSKMQDSVLGNNAFYLMINENVFPSYDEVHLNFYNKTKVDLILKLDLKNNLFPLGEIRKENLPSLKMKEVSNPSKDSLVWGKRDLDNPENDFLNNAFVVKTEEMQIKDDVEFKSQSTYLIWFECLGQVKNIGDYAYSCSKYNLKFHYKLLDYLLTSKNI
jgi:hypothetical protein